MSRRRRRRLLGRQFLALIDRTEGTNFGDMINAGGLAAAFDGITNQAAAATANKGTVSPAFVGKTLAAPRVFGQAIVYGSNDQGFLSGTGNITISIRGKTGAAPATALEGTELATLTFTDTTNESAGRVLESTDLLSVWNNLWAVLTHDGTNSTRCAELVLFAWNG